MRLNLIMQPPHYLETMQKKRSLLLLFSDVRTFLYEENALMYLITTKETTFIFNDWHRRPNHCQ